MVRESNEIGDDVSIGTHSIIEHHVRMAAGVRMHSNVFIPEYSELEAKAWIGPNVVFTNARFPQSPGARDHLRGPRIGPRARIGANATLLPGVEIGAEALVGGWHGGLEERSARHRGRRQPVARAWSSARQTSRHIRRDPRTHEGSFSRSVRALPICPARHQRGHCFGDREVRLRARSSRRRVRAGLRRDSRRAALPVVRERHRCALHRTARMGLPRRRRGHHHGVFVDRDPGNHQPVRSQGGILRHPSRRLHNRP